MVAFKSVDGGRKDKSLPERGLWRNLNSGRCNMAFKKAWFSYCANGSHCYNRQYCFWEKGYEKKHIGSVGTIDQNRKTKGRGSKEWADSILLSAQHFYLRERV